MSIPVRLSLFTATVAGLALTAGCTGGGGSASATGTTAQPDTAQTATVQVAAAPVDSVETASSAALDAIINDATRQQVSTTGSAKSQATADVPTVLGGAPADQNFTFNASGTLTVDLDAIDALGGDRFPNATGRFRVDYAGSAVASQPVGNNGNAGYTITITYLTDATFTNPRNGGVATVARDSTYSFTAEIVWTRNVTTRDWSIDTTTDLRSTGYSVAVALGGSTGTASISGSRHATAHLAFANGALAFTRDVVASWTAAVTRNGVPHQVAISRPSLNAITVIVDGVSFGPFTAAQAFALWKSRFE